VSTVGERVTGWLYLLGWAVVCRMPRRSAEWLFRQIADQLWRRQGPRVRQLEANLAGDRPRCVGFGSAAAFAGRDASYLRYWLEACRLPVIPPAEILGRMRAAGEEQTALRHLNGVVAPGIAGFAEGRRAWAGRSCGCAGQPGAHG
jgi:KDO2-lipid IV(A) lauroyltransferase